MNNILKEEAKAFDKQIKERVKSGHIPDLRRSGRCDYFYNNLWRDQEFVNLYYGEIVEKVIKASRKYLVNKEKIKILEVGCGPGQVSLELARNGFNVVGLDISGECIKIARTFSFEDPWGKDRGNLEYIQQDFMKHKGKYDIVLFTATLHHFPNSNRVLEHASDLLNPEGLVILDEPARDLVSKRNTVMILLIKSLLSSAGAYFQDLKLPLTKKDIEERLNEILLEEKYETENGKKKQSVMDNEAGFDQMNDAVHSIFHKLEFNKDYAFLHQIIGGIRLTKVEDEHKLAKFIKIIDSICCENNLIDPVNFFFVGRKRRD